MSTITKKPTQCERILRALQSCKGQFVSGRYFIQDMMISQAHARIWQLQKDGYNIVASDTTDQYGFKSYKLIDKGALL